jgi:hypothetical protein
MILFNDDAVGAIRFSVTWALDGADHEDIFIGRRFNAVNDIFPAGMRQALEGKRTGQSVTLNYAPRHCIPRYRKSKVLTRTLDRLRKKTVHGDPIVPRLGRFYPQGHIDGLLDVYPDTLTPFRLTGLTYEEFTADCNHPLALVPVTFRAEIQYMERRDAGTYGSLTHWREKTCDWGPGMQARHRSAPTDFFVPGFFDPVGQPDAAPAPPEPDATARQNIAAVTARFIDPAMRVLDLAPGSPPRTGDFDGAVCHQRFETLADPVAVLEQAASRLPSGAPVVIAFTEDFDPHLTVRGWTALHPFERMGLVLEFLRLAGLDRDAATVSLRNDWRAKDDHRFLETKGVSDPVYVVCGHKR